MALPPSPSFYYYYYPYLFLLFSVSGLAVTDNFIFTGFKQSDNLSLDGNAQLTPSGLIQLTNETERVIGHAFFPFPIRMLDTNSSPISFSTSFVFDIVTTADAGGNGIAFAVTPSKTPPEAECCQSLGLFGTNNTGNFSNHIFAVEFDTVQGLQFFDINDNHVGVDIINLVSNVSNTAAYYPAGSESSRIIQLDSGQPIQAWIDYDGVGKILNVTISPFSIHKPRRPLISYPLDLSPVLKEYMYVGFSSSTGKLTSNHYILGWSFRMNGKAAPLDVSKLPLPPSPAAPTAFSDQILKASRLKNWSASFVAAPLFVALLILVFLYHRQRAKLSETLEDWELDYPHRFSYKDLYKATKGFKDTELLGSGGFGQVYKGVLEKTGEEVAIKRISNSSKQGLREFVAEIVCLGQLRHRNLVRLHGWCKRNQDLILVYEYMHNGSLDAVLFRPAKGRSLSWEQRFWIAKGIAKGLLYLQEEWEQVVVHRDIKASNVLLDADMNGRLGDFGLARLYDHGENPHTTHVVGTIGYIAPELSRTGKATDRSDVFAYGMLLLEIVCGRRPVELSASPREMILVEWVRECVARGQMMEVVDRRMGEKYVREEVELVIRVGLLCVQSVPEARPSMRQVTRYLDGDERVVDDGNLVFSEAGSGDPPLRSYPPLFGATSSSLYYKSAFSVQRAVTFPTVKKNWQFLLSFRH